MNYLTETYIIAQLLAAISFALTAVGPQMKTRKQMLIIFGLANIFSSVHFWLLGAVAGSIIVMIAAIRFFVFTVSTAKIWLYLIFVFNAIALLYSSEGFFLGLLAYIAAGLVTVAAYSQHNHWFRIIIIAGMSVWLFYDIFIGSIVASLEDVFFLASSVFGYIRHRKIVWSVVK